MDHRHSTAAILALGGLIVVLEPGLPGPSYGTGSASWIPVAGVYLAVGVLLGGRRVLGADRLLGTDRTSVPYAVSVATVAGLIPMGLRLRGLLIARPELALADATFALAQATVFVPVVVGFMAPLGIAKRTEDRYLAAAAIIAVILAFIVWASSTGSNAGFGRAFVVVYFGFWSVAGAFLGLPLYLYGWSLREEMPEIVRRLVFPGKIPPE